MGDFITIETAEEIHDKTDIAIVCYDGKNIEIEVDLKY